MEEFWEKVIELRYKDVQESDQVQIRNKGLKSKISKFLKEFTIINTHITSPSPMWFTTISMKDHLRETDLGPKLSSTDYREIWKHLCILNFVEKSESTSYRINRQIIAEYLIKGKNAFTDLSNYCDEHVDEITDLLSVGVGGVNINLQESEENEQ